MASRILLQPQHIFMVEGDTTSSPKEKVTFGHNARYLSHKNQLDAGSDSFWVFPEVDPADSNALGGLPYLQGLNNHS